MFRILLADDEGIMLESLKSIISSNFGSECEIRCVKTGRAVVEQAETFHPDIAFVDIHMPGLSGIQAIQEIRKDNREMVVIIKMCIRDSISPSLICSADSVPCTHWASLPHIF